MELSRDDLEFFVRFVLLDVAQRIPAKRQTHPMNGLWMSRMGAKGMRESDAVVRRNVCIEALCKVGGMSIDKAAADVATRLGRHTSAQANVIRVGYHERKPRTIRWEMFFAQFLSFRAWVLQAGESELRLALDRRERDRGESCRERLGELFRDLKRDPNQRNQNLNWFTERSLAAKARIESKHWNPETDWQMLATDFWTVALYYKAMKDVDEARVQFQHARHLWETHCQQHRLRERALAALDEEMSRLAE
jgi:hypothetical protein